ncbi:MAG: HAD family phosphatase [Verrucomicrobiales bacterium]|nr:HAD family phosphatase [Verrucomicrobiales bacterium]
MIVHFDHSIAICRIAPYCERPVAEMLPKLRPLNDQFELGKFDTSEYVRRAGEMIGFTGTEAEFIEAFGDIFELNQPVADLIDELSAAGHRLCLLSNTNAIHVPFFTKKWSGVFRHFDQAVFSHEVGLMKPDPAIFDVTIELLGLDPSNTIYIDDLPDNCKNGAAAGLRAFQYSTDRHGELLDTIASFEMER